MDVVERLGVARGRVVEDVLTCELVRDVRTRHEPVGGSRVHRGLMAAQPEKPAANRLRVHGIATASNNFFLAEPLG